MNRILQILNKYEPFAYALIVLLNSLPIFIGKYFPSMDGPAHLHNALIIQELLFNKTTFFQDYYSINLELIPNWFGHIILIVSNWIFVPHISEKIILLLVSLGIPLVGRQIIVKLNPDNKVISYLFLPFVYSTSFILGFYNFSLGVLLFLITLYYWITARENHLSLKEFFVLFSLFTVTYFSHALVFLLSLSSIGLNVLFDFFKSSKSGLKQFLNRGLVVLMATMTPLLFFLYYSLRRNVLEASSFLEFGQLVEQLVSLDTLIGYNASFEKPYLIILFLLIAFMFSVQVYDRFKEGLGEIKNSDYWLILVFFFLSGYFLLPNSGGGAGFISMRLSYLFFILLIVWLSAHRSFAKKVLLILVPLSLWANWKVVEYYVEVSKDLNITISSIEEVSKLVPEGSVVAPIDLSRHWMMNHFSNYLAVERKIVVLENYESTLYYFPTQMIKETFPNIILGNDETGECISWIRNPNNNPTSAQYVFVLGDINNFTNSCEETLKKSILSNYKLDYKNEHCSLYVLK